MSDDECADYGDAPALQPAPPVQAPQPAPPSPLRSSLLKKPLDAGSFGGTPAGPPGFPPKFR